MKLRQPIYTDGEEPLTKEEVNSALRHAGYDPEEVGKKMDIVARQALKIAQLETTNAELLDEIKRLRKAINRAIEMGHIEYLEGFLEQEEEQAK